MSSVVWHWYVGLTLVFLLVLPLVSSAQGIFGGYIATTTVTTSICGNSLVEPGEDCDVPGETGVYSTSIAGRQCTPVCEFGPYCGDGILQVQYGEECDDGNNSDGDFCSAICKIEPAGSGGGGSSGGGARPSGGDSPPGVGDTQVSIRGTTIPSATVNILMDARDIGRVQANSSGRFDFTTESDPGTISMGFWAEAPNGERTITFNTVFDATQGAVSTVNGIVIPPTLSVSDTEIDPGTTITFSGYGAPETTLELQIGNADEVTTTVDSNGAWEIEYDTTGLAAAEYTLRARTVAGSDIIRAESGYSTGVQLFVGVDGRASSPSDLNRDGRVNLTDFSILIFWWGTNGGDSNPPADISGNGRVGLEDFSILLFNWTG